MQQYNPSSNNNSTQQQLQYNNSASVPAVNNNNGSNSTDSLSTGVSHTSSMQQSRSMHSIQSTPNLGIAQSSSSSGGVGVNSNSYSDISSSVSWNAGLSSYSSNAQDTTNANLLNKQPWEDKENQQQQQQRSVSASSLKSSSSSGYNHHQYRGRNNYENISALELSEPPTRDAASITKTRISQTHEKFPSWPHVPLSSQPANGRTGSWSEESTAASSSEFTHKPVKMAYQPMLNTHLEDKMSPKEIKRYLEENQLKSPKDSKPGPMIAKANMGETFPYLYNSKETFPLEKYRQDRKADDLDKDYAIHSPPERDTPIDNTSPPPPLPKTAPPTEVPVQQSPTVLYVSRNTPCYNTSTQTEDIAAVEPVSSAVSPSSVPSSSSTTTASVSGWDQQQKATSQTQTQTQFPNREHLSTPPSLFMKEKQQQPWDSNPQTSFSSGS